MLGALIGDYVGSCYEFNNIYTEEFQFFGPKCKFTDDSIMTVAVAQSLMEHIEKGDDLETACVKNMQMFARKHPDGGYGGRFRHWIYDPDPQPYNSWGNGSAMRVSAVGWLFDSIEKTEEIAAATARVTHNHPEGIKGAQAIAVAIFLARNGASKAQIKATMQERYGYSLDRTLAQIKPVFEFDESCQGTVPEALTMFLESRGYEDCVRKAISLGGDCDTTGCIAGAIAEAYYTVPQEMREYIVAQLPQDMADVVRHWHQNIRALQKKAS